MSFLKKENIDYLRNFYRYKLLKKETNQYLLTTDDGEFVFLNLNSFKQLKRGKITSVELYNLLLKKGIIINQNNINDVVEKTFDKYGFLVGGTSLHIVIPTHRCNLGCIYCFASSCPINITNPQNFDMTPEIAKKTVEFMFQSPSKAITIEFQGGEPLVRFDIIQIMIKYAKELNKKYKKDLRFALVSNFTLMTDEIMNFLIDEGVTFCTSLDGPKEVHDKNRFFLENENNKNSIKLGTYDSVIKWIKKINSEYKKRRINLKVGAVMTTTKYSLNYYKEIIDTYLDLNINVISIRSLTQVGKADGTSQDFLYSKEDFINFYQNSLNYIEELKKNNIQILEVFTDLFRRKITTKLPQYNTEYESPCGAAIMQILYHTNGNIYTCNEALGRDEFKLGNVFKDSWKSIFEKKEVAKCILNSMLEQNVMCDRCVYKPYCSTCMVENFYKDSKFNFYPTKNKRHHETIFHCDKIFNEMLKKELK